MEGFKSLPKLQCFKTGGSVQTKTYCGGGKAYKKGGSVDADDTVQDKKLIKKAIAMHDTQEHKGEKTDLSKLRKGGRAKKQVGTVRKKPSLLENIGGGGLSSIVPPPPLAAGMPPAPPAGMPPPMMRKGGKVKK